MGDLDELRVMLHTGADRLGIPRAREKIIQRYKNAPRTSYEQITKVVLGGHARAHAAKTRDRPNKLGKSWRFRFGEAQNWRCCYCGVVTDPYVDRSHPAKATYEHVQAFKHGGTSAFRNTVIACMVCNTLRGITSLTAMEFCELMGQSDIRMIVDQIASMWGDEKRKSQRLALVRRFRGLVDADESCRND